MTKALHGYTSPFSALWAMYRLILREMKDCNMIEYVSFYNEKRCFDIILLVGQVFFPEDNTTLV